VSAGRRLLAVADALPVTVLALIAGAGSFTHIRDTAAQHGQHGLMASAVAFCIDLMGAWQPLTYTRTGESKRKIVVPAGLVPENPLRRLGDMIPQVRSGSRLRPGVTGKHATRRAGSAVAAVRGVTVVVS
jgi:hypothetical protein